jgi:hypothetical protein
VLHRADGLRAAARAAQRLRTFTGPAGLWQDETQAHGLLGDIFERSDEPLLAAFHRFRAGNGTAALSARVPLLTLRQ